MRKISAYLITLLNIYLIYRIEKTKGVNINLLIYIIIVALILSALWFLVYKEEKSKKRKKDFLKCGKISLLKDCDMYDEEVLDLYWNSQKLKKVQENYDSEMKIKQRSDKINSLL